MSIAYSAQLICFLILSIIIVTGSLGVVLLENIVYSAFLLGGVFMAVAGLYLLLNNIVLILLQEALINIKILYIHALYIFI